MEEIISAAGLQTKGLVRQNNGVWKPTGTKADIQPLKTVKLDEVELSETAREAVDLEKTMENLQEYAGWGNFNIDFTTDDQTGSLVIMVIDRDTGETLRQIPPEQILKLRSHIQEVLGMVFDHMA